MSPVFGQLHKSEGSGGIEFLIHQPTYCHDAESLVKTVSHVLADPNLRLVAAAPAIVSASAIVNVPAAAPAASHGIQAIAAAATRRGAGRSGAKRPTRARPRRPWRRRRSATPAGASASGMHPRCAACVLGSVVAGAVPSQAACRTANRGEAVLNSIMAMLVGKVSAEAAAVAMLVGVVVVDDCR